MIDQEYLQQTQQRLETLQFEQRRLHERLATDLRGMYSLRTQLMTLAGVFALGLGLSVGYQLGRR